MTNHNLYIMDENTLIFIIVVVCFIALFLCCALHLFSKYFVHGKSKKRRLNAIKQYVLSPIERELIHDLINRTYVYSFTYGIHTSIHLLCSIESIVCSVGALAMIPLSSGPSWQNLSISVAAVIFIFITIYTKPAKRSSQYLAAWIEAEIDTLTYLNELNALYPQQERTQAVTQQIKNINTTIIENRKQIEYAITADFDDE